MSDFTLDPDGQHALDSDGNLVSVAGDWTLDLDGRQVRLVAIVRSELQEER